MAKRARRILLVLGLLALLLGILVHFDYQRDITRARERLMTGSRIAHTPCGPIEYAVAGQGPPILIVHGAGGGFDQGVAFGEPLAERGFRIIAMSRFGYLRTPLPTDASAPAQADAHACLLDALDIQQAAIVGVSAGAPSALQLALRHPKRVARLVLLVPATYVPRPGGAASLETPRATEFLFDTALKSDFLFWAAQRLARDILFRAILATPPELVHRAAPEEQARAQRLLELILPVRVRRLGLINDAAVTSTLERYPLERIRTPALAISFADDLFGTHEAARYTANQIPNARFMGYSRGGHVWIGHQQDVMSEILAFVK